MILSRTIGRTSASQWIRTFVSLSLVLGLAATLLVPLTRTATLAEDELPWIVSALYYTDLVREGDFTSSRWEGEGLELWGSLNPHLGRLWIGAALWLNPQTRSLHFPPEQFEHLLHPLKLGYEPQVDDRRLPLPASVIIYARQAQAVAGLVVLAAAFLLMNDVAGRAAATVSGLGLALSPPFHNTFARVYTDAHYVLFLLLLTWCLVRSARSAGAGRRLLWCASASACAGLAFNVKATGLVFGLALIAIVVLGRPEYRQRRTIVFACSALVAIFTAVLANPYFWPTAQPPPSPDWRTLLPVRLTRQDVGRDTMRGVAPVALRVPEFHARWGRQLAFQSIWFQDQRASRPTVLRRLFFDFQARGAGLALVALGLLATLRSGAIWRARTCWHDPAAVVLLSAIAHVVWLLVLRPLDWERYYLPALAHLFVAQAIALRFALSPTKTTDSAMSAASLSA